MQRTLAKDVVLRVGETVFLQGWVSSKRDHGKVTFIDLRDRSGKVQLVGYQKMGDLSVEDVVEVVGVVKERSPYQINDKLFTGRVEVDVSSYTVLNKAHTLPIPIDRDGYELHEELRLQYRYVDLKRDRLQRIFRLRSKFIDALRQFFFQEDFVEIETPLLTKSTKEGARDFVVPSRFHPGCFYALPQSPQQYKQLLMTAGFERYFQVARCIRDEDLRADRGFEFTQFDIEMSFVDEFAVMDLVERAVREAVIAVGGKLRPGTFPKIDYIDALALYGADKFDLRTAEEKQEGVLAFAWVVRFPFFKKVDVRDVAEMRDSKSGWTFTHNPFSKPIAEHEGWLLEKSHIGEILTTQYDLVCNGYEVGGGSIRAHRSDMLRAVFEIMGYTEEEIQSSVGHMLDAFRAGTPPHGGIALGLDRLVMLLCGEHSLKEVIAFPMTSTGRTAVMDAPSFISTAQLDELHIAVVE